MRRRRWNPGANDFSAGSAFDAGRRKFLGTITLLSMSSHGLANEVVGQFFGSFNIATGVGDRIHQPFSAAAVENLELRPRSALLADAFNALISHFRESSGLVIDAAFVRRMMDFEYLEQAAWEGAELYGFSADVTSGVREYLSGLAGYDKSCYGKRPQHFYARQEHGTILSELSCGEIRYSWIDLIKTG